MPPTKDPNKGMRFAREAMVVVVGAKAPVYSQVEVIHNKTGQPVLMNKDQPDEEAVEGIPYTFKQYQRVAAGHPAVKQSPHLFLTLDDLDDAELELVSG